MLDDGVVEAGPARPSLRARLLSAYIRLAIKPHSRRGFDVAWARRVLEKPVIRTRITKRIVVEPVRVGALGGEAVQPRRRDGAGRTILYLHGGGYFFGSSLGYRAITFALAEAARARVVTPDYRRAPEHPFPAALEDGVAAARGLYASGVSPDDLAVCGDSAGGGLALGVLTRLRDAGEPLPACAVLFSPWTDLAATGESLRRNGRCDPLFHGDCIAADARHYLGGEDPRNPDVSPLYADLGGLPPLLIQVGRTEVLLDDSLRLARKARLSGVEARCEVWTDLPHVWHLQHGLLPEARAALGGAAGFILDRTAGREGAHFVSD
jgi:monoterpene epsilon-lactone hydrolase